MSSVISESIFSGQVNIGKTKLPLTMNIVPQLVQLLMRRFIGGILAFVLAISVAVVLL